MINKLIFSLEQVEVKGKKNLDILLGCIVALETMKEKFNNKETVEGKEVDNG